MAFWVDLFLYDLIERNRCISYYPWQRLEIDESYGPPKRKYAYNERADPPYFRWLLCVLPCMSSESRPVVAFLWLFSKVVGSELVLWLVWAHSGQSTLWAVVARYTTRHANLKRVSW